MTTKLNEVIQYLEAHKERENEACQERAYGRDGASREDVIEIDAKNFAAYEHGEVIDKVLAMLKEVE